MEGKRKRQQETNSSVEWWGRDEQSNNVIKRKIGELRKEEEVGRGYIEREGGKETKGGR